MAEDIHTIVREIRMLVRPHPEPAFDDSGDGFLQNYPWEAELRQQCLVANMIATS